MTCSQDSTSRTATITARDWFAFNQMSRREQDAWLHERHLMAAPPMPEPPEDDQPEHWEIVENCGPTLVEITDYIGDGPDAEKATWTVEAGVNSPSYRLVAS